MPHPAELLALARAALEHGRSGEARDLFLRLAESARDRGDDIGLAEAAIGAGGWWLYELRVADERAAYLALIVCLILLIVTGLAIWKPVQLQELAALMGGYEGARLLHFFAMVLMVLIVVVHIVMVALVPRTFPTMITGRLRRS